MDPQAQQHIYASDTLQPQLDTAQDTQSCTMIPKEFASSLSKSKEGDSYHNNTGNEGVSSPTEHKQHLHLPLRKRHLLGSGNFHLEAPHDTNTLNNTTTTPTPPLESELSTCTQSKPSTSNNIQLQPPHTTPTPSPSTREVTSAQDLHSGIPDPDSDRTLGPPNVSKPTEDKSTKDKVKSINNTFEHAGRNLTTGHQLAAAAAATTTTTGNGNTGGGGGGAENGYKSTNIKRSPRSDSPTTITESTYSTDPIRSHLSKHTVTQEPTTKTSPLQSLLAHPQQHHPNHNHQHQHHPSQPSQRSMKSSKTENIGPPPVPPNSHAPSSKSGRGGRGQTRGGSGNGRGGKVKGDAPSEGEDTEEELYCFCRRPYDPTVDIFMICCDSCDEWYHGTCVGVSQREAKKISRYVCPRCKKVPTTPSPPVVTAASSPRAHSPSTVANSNKKRKEGSSTNHSSRGVEPPSKRHASSALVDQKRMEQPILGEDFDEDEDDGVSEEDDEEGDEEERLCLNCSKPAQSTSKYCGYTCGIEYAKKLRRQKDPAASDISTTPSTTPPTTPLACDPADGGGSSIPAESADRQILADIAKKKADIAEKLLKLDEEQQALDKAIFFARHTTNKVDPPSPPLRPVPSSSSTSSSPSLSSPALSDTPTEKSVPPAQENKTMDCVSCGHPIPISKFTMHIERCYQKKENNVMMVGTTPDGGALYCNAYDSKTKTYCKKLRAACHVHSKRSAALPSHPASPTLSSPSNVPSPTTASNTTTSTASTNGNSHHSTSSSYNSNLETALCGCPTEDFPSGRCELMKKACIKHYNWEELRAVAINNQRNQHNKSLVTLDSEEKAVLLRISRRTHASPSSSRHLHKTIVET